MAHLGALEVADASPVEGTGSLRCVTFNDPDGNVLVAAERR